MHTRALLLLGFLLAASACGSERRPGGPGTGQVNPTPRRDATTNPADGGTEPGEDGGEDGAVDGRRDAEPAVDFGTQGQRDSEPGAPDQGPVTFDAAPPFDAGFVDVGFPTFPDAQPRPDSGPPRPDSGPPPPPFDAGVGDSGLPPAQTQISGVPGSSVVAVVGGDVTVDFTLQFDNSGPNAETLVVASADASAIIVSQSFSVTPGQHLASVGRTQRTFSKVAGSGTPAIDPLTIALACQLGGGLPFPVTITVNFTNGSSAFISDAQFSCP